MNIELLTKMRDLLEQEAFTGTALRDEFPDLKNPKLYLQCYFSLPVEEENIHDTRFCIAGLAMLMGGCSADSILEWDTSIHERASMLLGLREDTASLLFFGGMAYRGMSEPGYVATVLTRLIKTGEVSWGAPP